MQAYKEKKEDRRGESEVTQIVFFVASSRARKDISNGVDSLLTELS